MLYDVVVTYTEYHSAFVKLYNRRVDFEGNIKDAARWAHQQETGCLLKHPQGEVYIDITSVRNS